MFVLTGLILKYCFRNALSMHIRNDILEFCFILLSMLSNSFFYDFTIFGLHFPTIISIRNKIISSGPKQFLYRSIIQQLSFCISTLGSCTGFYPVF